MIYAIGHNKIKAMMTGAAYFELNGDCDLCTVHYTNGKNEVAMLSNELASKIRDYVRYQKGEINKCPEIHTFEILSEVQSKQPQAEGNL